MEYHESIKPIMSALAAALEAERFLLGIGKYKFAAILKMKYFTYNHFISGKQNIKAATFLKILNYINNKEEGVCPLLLVWKKDNESRIKMVPQIIKD